MVARIPVNQATAMFARRQPRVLHNFSKRFQSSSAPSTQNPAYPLYPSVAQLLHQKNIPESEVSKIPASGPKGRLLKGDVLAYLGQISSDYPSTQAAQLAKLTHLDLSNIKIAAPAPKPAAPAVEEKAVPKAAPTASIAITVSLAAVLRAQHKISKRFGTSVPVSRFLAIAADLANVDLPRSKTEARSSDELFDELLGAEPIMTSRGNYVPEVNAFGVPKAFQAEAVEEDIIDILSAKPGKKSVSSIPAAEEYSAGATNVFSLTVPVGQELRAKEFLERFKTLLQVKPARLVV